MKPLIVVEGANDVSKIKSLGFKYVVKTGGNYVSRETITFVEEAVNIRPVYLVMDPDGPGQKIIDYIVSQVPNVQIISGLSAKVGRKKDRVGVAYYPNDKLLEILKEPYELNEKTEDETITDEQLIELGLSGHSESKAKRESIATRYSLQSTSLKSLYEGLNCLQISYEQLRNEI